MKLTFFDGDINFGDQLNNYLWPRILPADFLDDDESSLLLGIGSILFDTYPATATKFVIGSGYGGYTPAPNVHDGSWRFIFARGVETCRALGISHDFAVTDGAILLLHIDHLPSYDGSIGVAFMPHYSTASMGRWDEVCNDAGITYIDPRDSVETIIGRIRSSSLLLTEAMHGAIVADMMRVPWVPLKPHGVAHHRKWSDWASSVEVEFSWTSFVPTSLAATASILSQRRLSVENTSRLNRIGAACGLDYVGRYFAAQSLKQAARQRPFLSNRNVLLRRFEEAKSRLFRFIDSTQSQSHWRHF